MSFWVGKEDSEEKGMLAHSRQQASGPSGKAGSSEGWASLQHAQDAPGTLNELSLGTSSTWAPHQ